MTAHPLEYGSPRARTRALRGWPWRWIIVALLVTYALLALPAVPVREVDSSIDAVTGTMTWTTTTSTWLGGTSPSATRVDVSPLERRLVRAGIPWTPDPRGLHYTTRNLFGGALSYGCGSAPPIYELRPVQAEFVAASTDAELREFVRVLQSGTEAEQRAAIDAAADKGLRAMAASSGAVGSK